MNNIYIRIIYIYVYVNNIYIHNTYTYMLVCAYIYIYKFMGSFLRLPTPGAKCLAAAARVEQFQEEGQGLAKKSARNREISQGFHVDNRNKFGNTIGIHRDIHGILSIFL